MATVGYLPKKTEGVPAELDEGGSQAGERTATGRVRQSAQ
jgi:hypothetical protein